MGPELPASHSGSLAVRPRKELLAERDDLFALHDILAPEECAHFIALSQSAG